MSRVILGAILISLLAAGALADGFEMPRLPDFSLQYPPDEAHSVDRDIKTGSITGAHGKTERTRIAPPHDCRKAKANRESW